MKIPSLESLIGTAMRTVIRRAVWMIPKKYFWVVFVLTILASIFFNR